MAARVPFCDLRFALAADGDALEAASLRVLRSGRYVLGPEVAAFEDEWASFCSSPHAVGVGSGTDAIALILRGSGIGPGDDVLVPAYTAPATWVAVASTGARPVGVEVDPDSGLIDPAAAAAAAARATAAIVAVHLFGRLAPMRELRELADARGLLLIEDAAHAHGAREDGIAAGALGDATAFSFYPTKLLGALGDGGAVTTADAKLAASVRKLRFYGQGSPPGDAIAGGLNSRLDELQAAVLRARLERLPARLERLRALAAGYRTRLAEVPDVGLPPRPAGAGEPAWHQFTVRHARRGALREGLAGAGVQTAVHYDPLPPALAPFRGPERYPAAERLSLELVSLPFDWWLQDAQVDAVCDALTTASSRRS